MLHLTSRFVRPRTTLTPTMALALFLAGLPSTPAPLEAATRTVGSDVGNCWTTDLSAAIAFASDGDILLVEGKTWRGNSGINYNLWDKNLTIAGGYDGDCTETYTGAETILTSGGDDTVLEIRSAFAVSVLLSDLTLTGGDNLGGDGGGLHVSGDVEVTLQNVTVSGNQAMRGAGIFVEGENAEVSIFGDSSIVSNEALPDSAAAGGGLFCGSEAKVTLTAPASVSDNSSSGAGGGLFVTGYCFLELAGGDVAGPELPIEDNDAEIGAGAAVENGGSLSADGRAHAGISFRRNVADSNGGGVAIRGLNAHVYLDNLQLYENEAQVGAALWVADTANLDFGTRGERCDLDICNIIRDNTAHYFYGGSPFAVQAGGQVTLEAVHIHDNPGYLPLGLVGAESTVLLYSSLLNHNGRPDLISDGMLVEGRVVLWGTTIADQIGLTTVVRNQSGRFEANTSILRDSATLFWAGAEANLQLQCVVSPWDPGPSGPSGIVVADPEFVDAANGDYHLQPWSPARDLCPGGPSGDHDVYGDPRISGPWYDAGADEFSSALFSDGFEAGDTSGWS